MQTKTAGVEDSQTVDSHGQLLPDFVIDYVLHQTLLLFHLSVCVCICVAVSFFESKCIEFVFVVCIELRTLVCAISICWRNRAVCGVLDGPSCMATQIHT